MVVIVARARETRVLTTDMNHEHDTDSIGEDDSERIAMTKQLADFLLKGGRLIDPAGAKDGLFDIRVCNGRIDAIGTNLEPNGATVIDVKDHIVTPGLIDVHLHLMKGLGTFGVDPDIFGVGSGVTTVVDAGSAGHTLLNVFRNYVTDNAKTRVLNYINLSTLGGVSGPGYSILADPRLIDEAKIEQTVEANRDIIVGIKIMATGGALGSQGLKPLERARKLGDRLKIPLLFISARAGPKTPPQCTSATCSNISAPATSSLICSPCIPAVCSMATANSGRRCATPKNPAC